MTGLFRRLPTLGALLSLLGACAEAAPPSAALQAEPGGSEKVWLTTDADGARVIESQLGPVARVELSPEREAGLMALEVPAARLADLSAAAHEQLHRCAGFALQGSLVAAESAAAPRASVRAQAEQAMVVPYVIDNPATVTALLPKLQTANLQKTIEDLSAFPTRFHSSDTGKQASTWIRDRWQSFVEARDDVTVELIAHKKTPQASVALTITGAKQPTELVVLGGHLDSINLKGGLAPGADDNASGIAVLTEVVRVALEAGYKPDRSVVFYAYAAEEIGLVGSDEIAAAAKIRQDNVVGVLQFDMTNYNPAPMPYLAIVTDYTDAKLNEFARNLIDQYVGAPWKDTKCGYACSDHGSWNSRGFAAHYVHESTTDESNDHIHTGEDTLALTGGKADHSLYFARYGAAFMAELAKGTLAPPTECDAARPCAGSDLCQNGTCVASGGGGGSGGVGGGGDAAVAAVGGMGGSAAGSATAKPTEPMTSGGSGNAGGGAAGSVSFAGSTRTAGADSALPAAVDADAAGCACRVPTRPAAPRHALWLLLPALGFLARRHRHHGRALG